MNESGEKTSSSLALTEKRTTTHRPGGCVGIFFQLFDWNRRFAKKKLFSKKLLPPVRAKQASKKFKGDEKMPTSKLHLIADENKGGFPNMKKLGNRSVNSDQSNYETRAPSLVARLMGLESMPAIREKPKKASFSDPCDKGEKGFMNNNCGVSEREDMSFERGSVKLDSRPQKLQKTGQFDRKTVARFGAESALQIKSVLSRSRKHHHHHHHPKFVSPVKSPRISSGKNVSRTSRLIDAATKILEPGLQSSSKVKNALTYSAPVRYHCSNEGVTEGRVIKPEEQTKQSGFSANAAKSLMGQTSCKNCGNLLDVVDCRPNVDEGSSGFPCSVSNLVNGSSSEGTGRSKPQLPLSSFEQGMEQDFHRNWDEPMSLGGKKEEEMDNVQSNSRAITERKSLPHERLAPWPSSQPSTFRSNLATTVELKQRTQIQEQMPLGRDGTPPRSNSKLNNLESRRVSSAANVVRGPKDFVSLNRSLSGRTRPRVPTKVESSNRFVPEKKAFNGSDESLPPLRSSVRKRRTINAASQVESRGSLSSTATKPGNIQCDSLKGKGFGLNTHSINRTCVIKSRLAGPAEGNRVVKSNSSDVISFTFNSPLRQKMGTSMEMEEKTMDDEMKKPSSLKEDSIAALLEQKLKELISEEDDEFAIGGPPKRSTATILQELISALTAERPDIASPSTAETKHERYAGFCFVADHLSPGSVLEASFSSSSLDGSAGHRFCTESMDCSSDRLRYLGPDADFLDSATSLEEEVAGFKRVKALIGNVARILDAISVAGGRLTRSMLSHAKDVIVNAELVFRNVTLHRLDGSEGLFIGPVLLELETSANVAWTNINVFSGADGNKRGSQFGGFLFDFLVEFLDSKYVKYHYLGFRACTRLLSCNRERIIGEVEKEMNKWTSLAGMIPDEIVEWEMSHGLGKWTNFDIEAFESGDEVCGDILRALVDETLIELWECWQGSF